MKILASYKNLPLFYNIWFGNRKKKMQTNGKKLECLEVESINLPAEREFKSGPKGASACLRTQPAVSFTVSHANSRRRCLGEGFSPSLFQIAAQPRGYSSGTQWDLRHAHYSRERSADNGWCIDFTVRNSTFSGASVLTIVFLNCGFRFLGEWQNSLEGEWEGGWG